MDNIAHTLAGFTMARAGLDRTTRLATAALVIASNLPDADSFFTGRGGYRYFEAHRGVTHSFLGAAVLGAGLGVLLWGLDRWVLARRTATKEHAGALPQRAKLAPLVGISVLAMLVHLLFDSLNSYGVRPFLPFSARWFYGDLVFIIDPWYWLLMGAGLHLALRSGPAREALAWAGWLVLSLPVLLTGLAPAPSKAAWCFGLALIAVIRIAGRRRRAEGTTTPARVCLAALGLYCAVLLGLHGIAMRKAITEVRTFQPGEEFHRLAILPRPADPLHWEVMYETDGEIIAGSVSIVPGAAPALHPRRYRKNLDRPEVRAALETATGQAARRFCRYLFAEVRESPAPATVALRDARFATGGHDDWATFLVPPTRAAGETGRD